MHAESSADSVSATQLAEAAILLPPQDLNSAVVAPGVTTNNIHQPSPEVKCHLLMPKTTEGWEAANHHFHSSLVLSASSLSEKYSILTDGVYSYFQFSCGTKPVRKRSKKQRPLHNTSLKEVTRKKKLAKQELHQARQQGFPSEVIQSLAQQFFGLVRSHSRLKKAANARSVTRSVRCLCVCLLPLQRQHRSFLRSKKGT